MEKINPKLLNWASVIAPNTRQFVNVKGD